MGKSNNIGELFKSTRISRNIELGQIAQKTRININILKSIELNDFANLPNITYLKGFIKSLAKCLELNTDEVITQFEREYSEFKNPTRKPKALDSEIPVKAPPKKEESAPIVSNKDIEEAKERIISTLSQFINKKSLLIIAAIIIFAVIVKSIVHFIGQLNHEQPKKQTPISEALTPSDDKELKSPEEDILQMDANKDFLNKTIEQSESEEVKVENLSQDAPIEATKTETKENIEEKVEPQSSKEPRLKDGQLPYIHFYSAPSKMYTVIEDSPLAQDPEILPPSIKASAVEGKQSVYIKAKDGDTWISYQADNEDIKRFVLKQGRWVLITGDVVLLFMGNLNVATIFYNNKLIDAESRTGVKSFIFPQALASDYEYPLFPSYKGIPYKASEYKERMAPKPEAN